jgi:mRNA-degrading endonuclease toxin of MazEF toxin-antitoxin module
MLNAHADLRIVCPITEGLNLPPDVIHIAVNKGEGGLTKDSIVSCDQVKAVDVARLVQKRGSLSAPTMQKIDNGLKVVLDFK